MMMMMVMVMVMVIFAARDGMSVLFFWFSRPVLTLT